MTRKFSRRRPVGRLVFGTVSVAVALVTAACSTPSSASSAHNDVAQGATTPAAKTAAAVVARYEKAPTTIGITTPLKQAAPKGQTIEFLQCEIPQCKTFSDGIAAAAAAIGWNYKAIPFQNSNPPSLIAGLKQALQDKPAAVALSGLPQAVWQSEIPEYTQAGIPLIPFSVGDVQTSATVPVNISAPEDFSKAGSIVANWFIADSNAAGHALVVGVPSFTVLKAYADGITGTTAKSCPKCTVTTLNASLAQVGNNGVVPAVVSAIQRDPSIKYVLSTDGAFTTGLTSALKTIGRSDVKIAGGAPSVTDEQNLLNGTESAWTGQAYKYIGWQVVDTAARVGEGMPVPAMAGGLPQMLLVKSNVGSPAESLEQPEDYPAQFKRLWHVG